MVPPVFFSQLVLSALGVALCDGACCCVECLPLTIRPQVAAVGRRVRRLGTGEDGLRQPWALSQTYATFCLPQAS